MKYQNIDSIHLTEQDANALFKWKNNNKHLVRNFKPVLEEGVIVIDKLTKQFFKQGSTALELEVYLHEDKAIRLLGVRLENGMIEILDQEVNRMMSYALGIDPQEMINDALSLHASTMAYMENFIEEKQYVTKNVIRQGNSKKKGKKNKKKSIKIQRAFHVRVGDNTETTEIDREYERRTESWKVRGHWRTLKSGRKVWVKPYKKGTGDPDANIYEL